jgi:hypothetical protein
MLPELNTLLNSRHPSYSSCLADWEKYRLTFRGGATYREQYLEKLSQRETDPDFVKRKGMTPIPAFAKSAIKEIRNSIYQRMRDIQRANGTDTYMKAVVGQSGGVDNQGTTMNSFLGKECLDDLLVVGRVGVYVDAPILNETPTKATIAGRHPYLYAYQAEDILSWSHSNPSNPGQLNSLLLRDRLEVNDVVTGFPKSGTYRYRHYELSNGRVAVQFYSNNGEPIDQFGDPAGIQILDLERIPFVLFDIGDSLLTDVAEHQIALLNLCSTDINYGWRSNFPFLVEQKSQTPAGQHITYAGRDGEVDTGVSTSIVTGAAHGRSYPFGHEAPSFIAPPTDPLKISIELQTKLEHDIRKLVHLAVQTLATRASAESKSMDNQGLESGLSFIGETLEKGEREIAYHWAAYERSSAQPMVNYPTTYSLKKDSERAEEAEKLGEFVSKVPSRTAKLELGKCMVASLLGGKIPSETLAKIYKEIDSAEYVTSDVDTIIRGKEAGLVGDRVSSMALGFLEDEHLQAEEDHSKRIARIAKSQGGGGANGDPASRGVKDLSANPNAGSDEKKKQAETDTKDDGARRFRGRGKANK